MIRDFAFGVDIISLHFSRLGNPTPNRNDGIYIARCSNGSLCTCHEVALLSTGCMWFVSDIRVMVDGDGYSVVLGG